jgi:hypothetical protein
MKKKILFILGLLLMIIICFLFFYQRKSNKDEIKNDYRLAIEEKNCLQEGDIIFRRGFGIISDAIVKYIKSDYPISHCGIVVKDSLGKLFVIHTVSNTLAEIDGMQKDKLDVFVKGSHKNSIIVTRYNYENNKQPQKIAEQAKQYLYRQIPFDHQFDCTDSTAFFCTELIYMVFKTAIDVDLYEYPDGKKTNCMSFSEFLNPIKFKTILNHCDTISN